MEQDVFVKYQNRLSNRNKMGRFLWGIGYLLIFRPFSAPIFHHWRTLVLCLFGAKIGDGSKIHASVKIWAPWNLEVGERTAVGPGAECYNPGKIVLGNKVTVSQGAYLCAASHDYTKKENPLVTKPIVVGDFAWVAADAFVALGVNIGEGAVVGARSCVFKDVEPWTVVGGNPARFIKKRILE